LSIFSYVGACQDWPIEPESSVELRLNRIEIADLLGLSTEIVSRCFTAMRKMHVIKLPRPQEIRILQPEILYAIGYAPGRLSPRWKLQLEIFYIRDWIFK
jgi:hypothetical protein